VLLHPSRQIGRPAEIEQRLGQGLQLLQRQGLDFGGSGFTQGASAAVELAKGHLGLALCFTFLAASCLSFLPSPIQKILGGAGVEQLVGGNACDHHDLLLTMEWG
jgi:hypothetical protein